MRVLVVEDNERLARALVRGLSGAGHTVERVGDGREALLFLETATFEVVVLDLMLPVLDGFGVLDRMRARGDATPVLVLTARNDLDSRVGGLDSGADDYLVKPFELEELLARLRALVRRAQGAGEASRITVGDLEVHLGSKQVRRGGQEIRLSRTEYLLLECLAYRKERVVDRATLMAHVYEGDEQPSSNTLDVHIAALRRKIDRGQSAKLLHTRRGQGYMLSEQP